MRSATSVGLTNQVHHRSSHISEEILAEVIIARRFHACRIVNHSDGDWRTTNAAFEKVALSIESGERIVNADDVSDILNENQLSNPIMKSTRKETISRQLRLE